MTCATKVELWGSGGSDIVVRDETVVANNSSNQEWGVPGTSDNMCPSESSDLPRPHVPREWVLVRLERDYQKHHRPLVAPVAQ